MKADRPRRCGSDISASVAGGDSCGASADFAAAALCLSRARPKRWSAARWRCWCGPAASETRSRFWRPARWGFRDPAVPTGSGLRPRPEELCAVSGGYAYLIDTSAPERFTMIAFRPVLEVRAVAAQGLLLFVGHHAILAWGASGLAWQSEKLSDEGVTITAIEGRRAARPRLEHDDGQGNAVRARFEDRPAHLNLLAIFPLNLAYRKRLQCYSMNSTDRRTFLRQAATLAGAFSASSLFHQAHAAELQRRVARRRPPERRRSRAERRLLERHPALLLRESRHHQPQQRRRLALAHRRAAGRGAL